MSYALAIAIRPARTDSRDDLAFVMSGWINALAGDLERRRGEVPSWMDRNWLSAAQHALASKLLRRPGCEVRLAVHPSDEDQIFGCLVCEPVSRQAHWLYVKKGSRTGLGFRVAGIATRLMEDAFGTSPEPITASLRTATGTSLAAAWRQSRGWQIDFRSHALCEQASNHVQ